MDLRLSELFLKVLEFSRDEAVRTGWHNVCPDHITLGILRHGDNGAVSVLELLGIDPALFKARLDESLFLAEPIPWEERDSVNLCESAASLLQHAAIEARRCHAPQIEPLHYLLALIRMSGSYSHDFLAEEGISLRGAVEASGLNWAAYGLLSGKAQDGKQEAGNAAGIPDPRAMADAIEERILAGFTTENPHIS